MSSRRLSEIQGKEGKAEREERDTGWRHWYDNPTAHILEKAPTCQLVISKGADLAACLSYIYNGRRRNIKYTIPRLALRGKTTAKNYQNAQIHDSAMWATRHPPSEL